MSDKAESRSILSFSMHIPRAERHGRNRREQMNLCGREDGTAFLPGSRE